ncbi:hypothetical protein BH23ACT11_BH23ACT11_11930 [soil metagenome]
MKLGDAAEIWHSCEDVERSARFYRALGLSTSKRDGVLSIQCGSLHLKLTVSDFPSPTLTYRTENVDRVAARLTDLGVTVKEESGGALVYGPGSERILVAPMEEGDRISPLEPISSCLALPTAQIERSLVFWRMLGFLRIGGNIVRPVQWATIYDGCLPIILATTLSVSRPALWVSGPLTERHKEDLKAAGFDADVHAASPQRATLFSPEQLTLIYGQLL